MDLNKVIDIINDNDTLLDLYFTEKSYNGYSSFQAEIAANEKGENVLSDIKGLVLNSIRGINDEDLNTVEYNPTGVADDAFEITNHDYVSNYDQIIESFNEVETQNIEDNVDNLTFYTLKFCLEGEVVQVMRRVSKFRRLRSKGIIASFQGNTINEIDSQMVGIDGSIDLIDFNDEILILNHTALERIFNLSEKFTNTAHEVLGRLKNNNKISNFNLFEEDCMNDKRVQKTLTKMSSEDIDWEHCFDRFENVIDNINLFDLEIDYERAPEDKIVYEDKSQLMNFVRLIRDAYYKTIINEQPGYDDGIRMQ